MRAGKRAIRSQVIGLRVVGSVCVLVLVIGVYAKPEAHAEVQPSPVASLAVTNGSARRSAGAHTTGSPASVRLSPEGSRLTQESASLSALRERQGSPPVRLELNGVTSGAAVVPVGLDPISGDLAVPPSALTVAWYEGSPTPGQSGISVLAAHVDWNGEAGVFFMLRNVHIGATANVSLANGHTARFTVTRREEVAKSDLGRVLVASRAGPPQLALVTCGGDFDWHTRHYADNVVLFARPS